MAQYGTIWHSMAQYGTMWHCMALRGPAQPLLFLLQNRSGTHRAALQICRHLNPPWILLRCPTARSGPRGATPMAPRSRAASSTRHRHGVGRWELTVGRPTAVWDAHTVTPHPLCSPPELRLRCSPSRYGAALPHSPPAPCGGTPGRGALWGDLGKWSPMGPCWDALLYGATLGGGAVWDGSGMLCPMGWLCGAVPYGVTPMCCPVG
ncbi:uncharacterized protein LOC122191776 [Lagopus leucura]|uniref:uncharacterized protein LOC122191776 n=1 Tax=Lagopus leucura TaxID=30410 RepID=UPI001C6849D2|nr:uncharacterized protein LOC122191776 [Lagopus leucura]